MGNQLSLRTGRTSSNRRRPPPRTTTNSNTNAHEMVGNGGISSRHRPPRTAFNPDFNADMIDRGSSSSGRAPSRTTSDPKSNTDDADLNSYEAACRDDPDLRSFDSTVQLRSTRAINSIAVGLESLLEMNHKLVQIILQKKKDIWENQKFFDLVNDCVELTRDFCTALDSCLKKAGIVESSLNIALKKFEEHYGEYNGEGSVKNLLQTKKKLDKKLKKLKARKKVSNVIILLTSVSVSICTVVAAAFMFPPAAAAAAAAAAVTVLMKKWINSIWKKREKDLMGQREVWEISSSEQIASRIIDLKSISILLKKFRIKMREDDQEVVIAMKEIRKKVDGFIKTINQDLSALIST